MRSPEHFYYKFSTPDGAEPAAWHVGTAEWYTRGDGRAVPIEERTLTPDQAEKEGFTLPGLLDAINVDTLKHADTLRSALFALNEEYNRYKEITTAKLEEAKTLMDAAERAFAAQEADAKSKSEEIADLKAKLAEKEAPAVEPRSDG